MPKTIEELSEIAKEHLKDGEVFDSGRICSDQITMGNPENYPVCYVYVTESSWPLPEDFNRKYVSTMYLAIEDNKNQHLSPPAGVRAISIVDHLTPLTKEA